MSCVFISKRMMIKELTLANEKNFVFSFRFQRDFPRVRASNQR